MDIKELSDAFARVVDQDRKYNMDCLTDSVKQEFCRFFQENISEKIAYARKSPKSEGRPYFVVSEKGVYTKFQNDFLGIDIDAGTYSYFFSWEEINRVEYSTKTHDFYLYRDESYDHYFKIGRYELLCSSEDDSYCLGLAEKLTAYAKQNKGLDELINDVYALEDEQKFEDALKLADKLVKENEDDEILVFLRYLRGREYRRCATVQNVENSKAVEYCDKAIVDLERSLFDFFRLKLDDGDIQIEDRLHFELSEVYMQSGDVQKARKHAIAVVCNENCSEEMRSMLNEIEKSYMDNYIDDYEYSNRKYIMLLKNTDGCYSDKIEVFSTQKMPIGLILSTDIPRENQVYIGHPYNKSIYVPLQNMEEIFFKDKFDELCYLLQCLGAMEISVTTLQGKNVEDMLNSATKVTGNADVKAFSGGFSTSSINENRLEGRSVSERTVKFTLDPMRYPYVPKDLVWYPKQSEWQRLVKSRFDSNILSYEEEVSTSQVRFTSSTEKEELRLSARYLWAKANVSVETNANAQFKESSETKWKIEVKFRSLKDFENPQVNDSVKTEKFSPKEKGRVK